MFCKARQKLGNMVISFEFICLAIETDMLFGVGHFTNRHIELGDFTHFDWAFGAFFLWLHNENCVLFMYGQWSRGVLGNKDQLSALARVLHQK